MPNSHHGPLSTFTQSSRSRSKRTQVVRACDTCRQHRIKCDSRVPCSNCNARATRCSNAAVRSMPPAEAYREIERLRLKVQELEKKLEPERRENDRAAGHQLPSNAPPLDARGQHALLANATIDSNSPRPGQNGLYIRTSRSGNETWYGDSSLFRFIERISSLLTSPLGRSRDSEEMLNPNSSSTFLDEPPGIGDDEEKSFRHEEVDEVPTASSDEDISLVRDFLSPMHEEYFLGLYWASYNTSVFPVLDETQFKQLYRSLCSPQGSRRLPSALVDIVVAICIQLGSSSSLKQAHSASHSGTAVPGRQYFLRCQQLLAYEQENPTLSTLQCQILSSVYLCSATFHNMSDSMSASAVRTAYMLGLHVDPPDSISIQEREMRRRLWWAIFILDGKIGIKYGRPFLFHWTTTLPPLPDDDPEAAIRAGSELTPLGNSLSWLSFHREHSKLFLVARSVYARCYSLKGSVCSEPAPENCRDVLESREEILSSCLKEMEAWAAGVPHALQTRRANNGRPLSTDTADIIVEPFSPLWLQRQRLLLELMYHNLCINLYRPFIHFGQGPASDIVEQTVMKCAWHGITLTRILHQVLSSTSILTGWHEAFQWQWNAAMTLAGFVLAFPGGDSTSAARSSLEDSVANLDNFGRTISAAASAADVVRKVQDQIDQAFSRDADVEVAAAATRTTDAAKPDSNMAARTLETPESTDIGQPGFGFDEMAELSFLDVLNMASSVDQYADPNMLWHSMIDFGTQS